jgi:hypothetical protein
VDEKLAMSIHDAQDVEWVVFRFGGLGDPIDWRTSIVAAACEALGVTEAFDEDGADATVAQALELVAAAYPEGFTE